MPRTNETAFLIWSLQNSGAGTTITTSGNSGSYTATTPNSRTAVDLRWADDLWLSVNATAGAGTALTAQLDAYDDQGNLFTQLLKVTLASSPNSAVVFGGRHGGGGSGTYFVLPEWGRVSWALTGSMTGVEIALYGR
jgi:hypothetical protein